MTETTDTYDGDVTLTGHEDAPVAVRDPEDVFLRRDSVDGDIELRNPEYVFTHQQPGDGGSVGDPETVVRGDLEDGYAEPEGVTGDAEIADAEDVFVEADTASGDLSVVGPENVYSDDVEPPGDRDYDVSLTGWKQSGQASDPDVGVRVTGAHHEVTVEKTRTDLTVYVVGHGHEVEVDGRAGTVSVYLLGYENTVQVGGYLDAEVVADTGFDNEVVAEPYPVEDLIETSKEEAFDRAGFGRRKVTYQVPAEGDDWCPNCGEPADAIVARHQMEAFFVFGYPLKTYERSTNPAKECEHCSREAFDASLTERERKDVLK